ncbi:MAG TPA: Smr/MutS family protein, partial [Myxococcaceae bacterium]|nr:Smr/MutS family protein [Myxococcaceae bacterium]
FRAEDRGQERSLRKAAESAPVAEGELRCDVRGLRLEDAVRQVEVFLDRAFQDGRTEAVIVHGHGTGALKRGIRELLAQSRYLRMYRPGDSNEGGDGVTWIAFRQ